MVKPILICFSGMDGSGKTSHAFSLLRKLKKRGLPCKYTWCRWVPGSADVFHFVIRNTLGYTADEYRYCKPLRVIFSYLRLLDFVISLFLRIKIYLVFGSCVIIDRYVYDALADLCLKGFDISSQKVFVKLFLILTPKPHITFLIYVAPRVALTRKNDISLADAIRYEKIYDDMAKIYGFEKVANIDFHRAHCEIVDKTLGVWGTRK